MAQVYKMMLGTSGRQWEQLTVREDGTMMLYFHGTDRSVTTQVTLIEDGAWKGWLRSEGGSLYPGIESGKWNKMDDGRGKMEDVVETTEPAEQIAQMAVEPYRGQSPCNPPSATHIGDSSLTGQSVALQSRVRRQRKPRKPRVERQTSSISPQPSDIRHQTSSTLKAVGMVAAATVALFVIYETGLLIPLGLIGLATGGILK